MESFVFEQQVLFSIDIRSVTSHLKVQCPRVGVGVTARVYVPLVPHFHVLSKSTLHFGVYNTIQLGRLAKREHIYSKSLPLYGIHVHEQQVDSNI